MGGSPIHRASLGSLRKSPTLAARLFAALILSAVVFQLGLVAGLPWGELAWGGRFPGRLPPEMRLASAGSALLLLALGAVVLNRAGLWLPRWRARSRGLVWGVVAYCALGVLANALTPSPWERALWLPVTLGLLLTSLTVALACRGR